MSKKETPWRLLSRNCQMNIWKMRGVLPFCNFDFPAKIIKPFGPFRWAKIHWLNINSSSAPSVPCRKPVSNGALWWAIPPPGPLRSAQKVWRDHGHTLPRRNSMPFPVPCNSSHRLACFRNSRAPLHNRWPLRIPQIRNPHSVQISSLQWKITWKIFFLIFLLVKF